MPDDRSASTLNNHHQDAPALLGMRTTAAALIGLALFGSVVLTARHGFADTGTPAAAVTLALGCVLAGIVIILRAPGDPLPMRYTVGLMVLGPASAAAALACIPSDVVTSVNSDIFFFNGGITAIVTFMCVRGRWWAAWITLVGKQIVVAAWGAETAFGIGPAISNTIADFGPLLMATWFGFTIRPAVSTVFALRERTTARAAQSAASAAAIAERDAQLTKLDALAGPLMARIASGAALTDAEMVECRLLEATLRDTLRAPTLATAEILDAASDARRRGVEVSLLDDGGLAPTVSDQADDGQATSLPDHITDAVVRALTDAVSGRVTARVLPPGRASVLTVVHTLSDDSRRTEVRSDGTVLVTP